MGLVTACRDRGTSTLARFSLFVQLVHLRLSTLSRVSTTSDVVPCLVQQLVQFALQEVGFFILHGFSENVGVFGMLSSRSMLAASGEQVRIVRLRNDGVVHVEWMLFTRISSCVCLSVVLTTFQTMTSATLSKRKKAETDAEEVDDDYLFGFSTDEDSSDDEGVSPGEGVDISRLPTIAKDDATVQRKLEKAKRQPTEHRGVICISRLPHGFYEDQLRGYFSQFGEITRLRVSRNKKTGKSKHYAFLEFESASVSQIVAETMDNYLLMGHILQCRVIPKDEVHPELWVGANRNWRKVPRDKIARIQHHKPRSEDSIRKAEKRLLRRQRERKRKLEECGIKYDFDAVSYKRKSKS